MPKQTNKERGSGKKARGKRSAKPTKSNPADDGACDVCGALVREIHCRLVCPNCGSMRDCSDP
jgi:hypothetical protein